MYIRKLRITFFLFCFALLSQFALGQDISDKIDSLSRKDDAAALATLITPENVNDCYGDYSALSIAIRNNAPKCVDVLLEKGADVNKICNNYKSPIFLVVKYGDVKIVEKLVAKGAKLDGKYKNQSLVEYAKRYQNEDIIKYLESRN